MKNTPTTLKWLAEQRARLLHDLAAAEQVAADVNKAVDKLREQLAGIDVCLKIYDKDINPELIAPVNGWKGTYGKRGNLRETILGILKLHSPKPVTTNLIESLVAFEHKLLFATQAERRRWYNNSLRSTLKILCADGLIEREHPAADGVCELGRWKLKLEKAPSLAELRTSVGGNLAKA